MKPIHDNYITIQGWMVTALKLKGSDLQLFALIHGFCQDGKTRFSGSLSYIETWLNASRPTAIAALERLTSVGWIIKYDGDVNQPNEYSVNWKAVNNAKEVVKNLYHIPETGSKETLPEVVKKLYQGSKETLPNIDTYNTNDKIESTPAQILVTTYQLETIPEPAKPHTKVSDIQQNPNAYNEAAVYLLTAMKDLGADDFPGKFAVPYFLNEMKKGRWVSLILPNTPAERHKWIGEHGAGVRQWAINEVKYNRTQQGQPAAQVHTPQISREI